MKITNKERQIIQRLLKKQRIILKVYIKIKKKINK